jgi:type VI secretion system protein ImpA
MASIDVDSLLQPVTEDAPVGADLEYDPAYMAAFRAAEGTQERQMGDTLVAGEEPDWRAVGKAAAELLSRTKDLRVAVLLTRALLRTQGLAGLDQGLTLIHGLVERYWDDAYPQLDPSDDNDPTLRVNILLDLCSSEAVLHTLRIAPLVRSKVLGPLSLRDVEIAEGRASAPADIKPLDPEAVRGVFMDCDLDELQASAAAASSALQHVSLLSDALGERIRLDQMPSFDPLAEVLTAISRLLGPYLAERLPAEPSTAAMEDDATGPETWPAEGSVRGAGIGEIASRDDVARAIDRICDYYSRYEPSSPVPLLLHRAKRLATGNFIDIVRDLAPDAMGDIEKICGLSPEA